MFLDERGIDRIVMGELGLPCVQYSRNEEELVWPEDVDLGGLAAPDGTREHKREEKEIERAGLFISATPSLTLQSGMRLIHYGIHIVKERRKYKERKTCLYTKKRDELFKLSKNKGDCNVTGKGWLIIAPRPDSWMGSKHPYIATQHYYYDP